MVEAHRHLGPFRRRLGLESRVDAPAQAVGQPAGPSAAGHPHRHASGGELAVGVNVNRQPGDEVAEDGHAATVTLSGSSRVCASWPGQARFLASARAARSFRRWASASEPRPVSTSTYSPATVKPFASANRFTASRCASQPLGRPQRPVAALRFVIAFFRRCAGRECRLVVCNAGNAHQQSKVVNEYAARSAGTG